MSSIAISASLDLLLVDYLMIIVSRPGCCKKQLFQILVEFVVKIDFLKVETLGWCGEACL